MEVNLLGPNPSEKPTGLKPMAKYNIPCSRKYKGET